MDFFGSGGFCGKESCWPKTGAGAIKVPADYSQLGDLLILSTALGFALPLLAILFVKSTRFRSA